MHEYYKAADFINPASAVEAGKRVTYGGLFKPESLCIDCPRCHTEGEPGENGHEARKGSIPAA